MKRRFIRARGELGVLQYGKFRHKSIRNQSSLVQLFTEQLVLVGERPFPTEKLFGFGWKTAWYCKFP